MATAYRSPGVYIEEIPKFPPSVAPVQTAIPAFIGYTQKADHVLPGDLVLKPFRITSMAEYELHFGLAEQEAGITVVATETRDAGGKTTSLKFEADSHPATLSKHIMNYALQMYFANGGGPCYIVSVALYKALVETEMKTALDTLEKVDEPTLLVFPEAQALSIADFKTIEQAALDQCALLKDRFVIMDVHGGALSLSDPKTNLLAAVANFRSSGSGNNNLKYGAAYAPNIDTVLDYVIDETKTVVSHVINGAAPVDAMLSTLKDTENSVYEGAKAAIRDLPLPLPPSAAMAGIYAAVDNDRGVWKAPANISVNAVIKPSIEFTNRDQEDMNVDSVAGKSVNAIRPFTGKGTLVWGARTLAGNDSEWRYVNVRRFFIFVEESIKNATGGFVFEPNDANTWVRVQGMCENFLTTLWRQGAMQGIKPEHAFYVAVGLGKTMTAQDILDGRMIIEIGMAAVRPAEFIILRFSHKMAES
jgi:phage tail sheath protein FI